MKTLFTPLKMWSPSLYADSQRKYHPVIASSSQGQWSDPFDYQDCESEELRTFLLSRTKTTATRLETYGKSRLISLLEHLDETATFPKFLELAPELRLNIFGHLLRIDTREPDRVKNNYAAILRVSKLLNIEAHPVLYSVNDFRLRVAMYRWGPNFEIDASESRRYRLSSQAPERTILSTPTTRMISFQVYLMRGLKVLTIDVFNGANPKYSALPFHCLMTCEGSRLTHIRVILHNHFLRLPEEEQMLILQPLALLRSSVTLDVQGASTTLLADLERKRQGLQRASDRSTLKSAGEVMLRGVTMLARHLPTNDTKKMRAVGEALRALESQVVALDGHRASCLRPATLKAQRCIGEAENDLRTQAAEEARGSRQEKARGGKKSR